MSNTNLNIAQAEILNKFKSLIKNSPKDIDIEFDSNEFKASFELNDEFELVIYFDCETTYTDKYSMLVEGTKYREAVYASQYDSDLDEECNIDLSFMLEHIENFICSGKYKNDREVFFDGGDLEKSWVSHKEHYSPMKTYGLSNSDFI